MKNFIEILTEKQKHEIIAIDLIARITKEIPLVDNDDLELTAIYLKDGTIIISTDSIKQIEAKINLNS